MFYFVKSPWILQQYYWECLWKIKTGDKKLYLTFDDGPDPEATTYVLDLLAQYNAQATFFQIGSQVMKYPELHQRVMAEGHTVGNHTYSHLNGWKTNAEDYLKDVRKASEFISGRYFRPPYGRITKFQLYNLIRLRDPELRPVMWHVLSGDFDKKITPDQCYLNVIRNAVAGSIVVFHDSIKTLPIVKQTLPKVLSYYAEQGFSFERITDADK